MTEFVKKRQWAVTFVLTPCDQDPDDAITEITRIVESVSDQDAALDIMAKFDRVIIIDVEPWVE